MKRLAIVANHGIGFHKPYAHAIKVAGNLRAQLQKRTGRTWSVTRAFRQVDEGTRIADIPHFAYRVAPDDVKDDDVIVDVFEPSWSEMTKGFVEKRTLVGAIKAAVRSIGTSYRGPNRKSFVDTAMLLLYAAIAAVVVFAPFPAACYLVLTHLTGYSVAGFFGIVATLMIAGNLFSRGFLILMGAPAVVKDFKAHFARNQGTFLPLRAIHAYLEAYPARPRAYAFISVARGFGLAYVGCVLAAPAMLYAYLDHLHFVNRPSSFIDFVLAAIAVSGPTVVRLLAKAAKKAFGPLEDVYTFCAFTVAGGCIDRRDAVVDRSSQVVMDVLHTVHIGTDERFYDEVHLFGHSMGSYLAMRSLAKLCDAVQAGALQATDFARIKTLTTYGAAVEKILAYFGLDEIMTDVQEATVMATELQILGKGKIEWVNLYYLTDIVADYIGSCGSICQNHELPFKPALWSHSLYVEDSNFWERVLTTQLGFTIEEAPLPAPTLIDDVQTFLGDLDKAPVFSDRPTLGGYARAWSIIVSLVVALWCMGHLVHPVGLLLGICLPFGALIAVQLSDSEKK